MIRSRIQAEEKEQEEEEEVKGDGVPVVNAELGRKEGTRPPILPAAQRDIHVLSQSSGGSHLTAVWEQFKRKKRALITKMSVLEADTTGQPDMLLYRAEKLTKELELLGIVSIDKRNEEVPNLEFLKKFGDQPDNLTLWHEDTGSCIK